MKRADILDVVITAAVAVALGFTFATCTRPASAQGGQGVALPEGVVAHIAHEAAQRHDLPQRAADRLVCLARYEATYRPNAVNGQYRGLMQFGPALWWRWAPALGYTTDMRHDPYAAIDVAAYVGSRGGWSNWEPVWDGRC